MRIPHGLRAALASQAVPSGGDPNFANVSLLLHGDGTNGAQNNTFLDSSTNNFTITRGGATTQGSFSPFPPASGIAYSASTHGGSGYFRDSVADFLTTPSSAQFNMGTGDWTVEGWFYGNKALNQFNVAWHVGTINATNGMAGSVASNSVGFRSNGTTDISASISIANQWAHIAWVKVGSSNTVTIYVNGTSVASGTYSNSIATGAFTCGFNNNSFRYGGYISTLRVLKGTALYTSNFTPPTGPLTAITNTSLLLNFTNGGIIDNASKNVLETVGNAQISTSVKKFGTGSMYFDGTGDSLAIRDSSSLQMGSGNFTIEFWINFSSITGYVTPFNKGYTSAGGLLFQSGNGNGRMVIYVNGSAVITETGTGSTGTWIHYALVRNGSTLTLYRDGTSSGSATNSTNINNTSTLYIGSSVTTNPDYPINGYIDDLRITKGVARYTANFTPPTAAFPDF